MSTNAIVARATKAGFSGRYVHSDGYPTGTGAALWKLLQGPIFKGAVGAMLDMLIDQHPAGWSELVSEFDDATESFKPRDFTQAPGYIECGSTLAPEDPTRRRARCYCHGDRHEPASMWTERDILGEPKLWVYIFDEVSRTLRVLHGDQEVGMFSIDGKEPAWKTFDNERSYGPRR